MTPQVWAMLGIVVFGSLINAAVSLVGLGQIKGDLKRIFRDFPPHRHINGKILFPADYEPTDLERLGGNGIH